jgi:hypothetical protein
MADDALRGLIESQRLRGVQLAGKQKKQLTKAIQQSGPKAGGKKITASEIAKAKNKAPQAAREDYLATVARTFRPNQLAGNVKKKLTKQGFQQNEAGYFTKAGPVTQSVLDKVRGQGFDERDIRNTLAKDFAANQLDEQVSKFLTEGGGFRINPTTGRFESQGLNLGPNDIPGIGGLGDNKGPFAGIDPDAAPGATPAEFEFAARIDPFKIEAKSRERLGLLQAGLGGYLGRLQAGSAERINRASNQAQRDISRLQEASQLTGQKLTAGTEFDIARLSRIAGLQQAKTQQATSLYNLIPSAFTGSTIG